MVSPAGLADSAENLVDLRGVLLAQRFHLGGMGERQALLQRRLGFRYLGADDLLHARPRRRCRLGPRRKSACGRKRTRGRLGPRAEILESVEECRRRHAASS